MNPTPAFLCAKKTLQTLQSIQRCIKSLSDELAFIASDIELERQRECTHAWYRVTCDVEILKCRHCSAQRRAPYATADLNHLLPLNHPSRYPRRPEVTERIIEANRDGLQQAAGISSHSDSD